MNREEKLNIKHPDRNESVCYVMMVQTVRLKMKFTFCLTALGENTYHNEKDLSAELTKLSPKNMESHNKFLFA